MDETAARQGGTEHAETIHDVDSAAANPAGGKTPPMSAPSDDRQALMRQYDADDYRRHSAPQLVRGRKLAALANLRNGDEVLDVGCGDGRTTLALFSTNRNVKRIVGYDVSANQIAAAEELASREENADFARITRFVCEDFAEVRLPDDELFTLAFSNLAVHWIGSVAYRRMFDALKPGGRMCVEQCGHGDLRELHDACLASVDAMGLGGRFAGWRLEDHGYYVPRPEELEETLTVVGFDDVNVRHETFAYETDLSENGIYEAFLASSLYRYYNIIADYATCVQFRERVRQTFRTGKVPAHAHRLIVTARKPDEPRRRRDARRRGECRSHRTRCPDRRRQA